MILNGYEQKLNIKYSEIDQNQTLKPFALLNFLQDIASENAENLGFGYDYLHPKNLAWFLIKYRMEFENYPQGIQDIVLKTEPRGYNKLFAYRDFEIYTHNKLSGRISSVWSVVDIDTRSIVPVEQAIVQNPLMVPKIKREDDLEFAKISALKNPSLTRTFEVRYNDLDVNGHANNGNYVIWAFEPLSFEFKNQYRIKTLDMIYKKEAKYGEKLVSKVEFLSDNRTLHLLQNLSGEDLFVLECCWT